RRFSVQEYSIEDGHVDSLELDHAGIEEVDRPQEVVTLRRLLHLQLLEGHAGQQDLGAVRRDPVRPGLEPSRRIDYGARQVPVARNHQLSVLGPTRDAGGNLEARKAVGMRGAGLGRSPLPLGDPVRDSILGTPVLGETPRDEEDDFEELGGRPPQEENFVASGAAYDDAESRRDLGELLLDHAIQEIQHGHIVSVLLAESRISVDIDDGHIDVGDRGHALDIAREMVLPIRYDDFAPHLGMGTRRDIAEEAPIESPLKLEGLLQNSLRSGALGQSRAICPQGVEGYEIALYNLVGKMDEYLIGRDSGGILFYIVHPTGSPFDTFRSKVTESVQ